LPVGAPDLAAARRRRREVALIVLPLVVAILVLIAGREMHRSRRHRSSPHPPRPYVSPSPNFSGDSTQLRETVIVPTLDTPMPKGKNVIWCSSFELAWNRLRNDVVKEPVRIKGAESIANRLNASTASEADLMPESVFAAAGRTSDGIVERIRREMAERFPDHALPEFGPDAAIIAYAYLKAAAEFTLPFFDNEDELAFADAAGKKTGVASFGLPPNCPRPTPELPGQVALLYSKRPEEKKEPT
jgi:hypothetical protein